MYNIKSAWRYWKENNPANYSEFKHYREKLKRKDYINANRCISGIMDIDGEIDEFELEKYLDSRYLDPLPLDSFFRMNS